MIASLSKGASYEKILQRLTLVAASTTSMFAVAGEGEVLVILSVKQPWI